MQRASVALAALALAAPFASCGGGAEDDGGAAFIARYCDAHQPCCAAAGLPTDGRACRALFESQDERPKYVAAAGTACLTALEQMAAAAGFCEGQTPEPAACGQAFGSEPAPGSTCAAAGDCSPSTAGQVRCAAVAAADGAELRKCQVLLAGQEGSAPCVGTVAAGITSYDGVTGSDVAPEAYLCDRDAGLRCSGSTCVRLLTDGEACDLSGDCADTAFCDVTLGTCAARKPLGATCGGQALECAAGAYCDEAAFTCAAQLADGTTCVANVQCQSGNCSGAACAPPASIGLGALCGSG